MLHLGTYNGNPLVMAAARAVLAEACTPEATAGGDRPQPPPARPLRRDHRRRPACRPTRCSSAPRAASPGPTEQVRNYRDYKATDFDLAFAQWIHGINRGVLLPPGLDEQWLVSVMHDETATMMYADVFEEFVDRTRGPDVRSRRPWRHCSVHHPSCLRPLPTELPDDDRTGGAAAVPAVRRQAGLVHRLLPNRRTAAARAASSAERGLAGFMTGAMTMNIIITFGLIAVTMVALFVATFPDPPVVP